MEYGNIKFKKQIQIFVTGIFLLNNIPCVKYSVDNVPTCSCLHVFFIITNKCFYYVTVTFPLVFILLYFPYLLFLHPTINLPVFYTPVHSSLRPFSLYNFDFKGHGVSCW